MSDANDSMQWPWFDKMLVLVQMIALIKVC